MFNADTMHESIGMQSRYNIAVAAGNGSGPSYINHASKQYSLVTTWMSKIPGTHLLWLSSLPSTSSLLKISAIPARPTTFGTRHLHSDRYSQACLRQIAEYKFRDAHWHPIGNISFSSYPVVAGGDLRGRCGAETFVAISWTSAGIWSIVRRHFQCRNSEHSSGYGPFRGETEGSEHRSLRTNYVADTGHSFHEGQPNNHRSLLPITTSRTER